MSVDHYENFPVASLLCPRELRPAVSAIYWFARTADDLADEGSATAEQRLADLRAYGRDLRKASHGARPSYRWKKVFVPLRQAIRRHGLPVSPLQDLLNAFEQDLVKQRYADRHELLDYCRRSAEPIGRLLLHLYGVTDASSLRQSDSICTALQLINFWQDLSIDVPRNRLYIPASDCHRRGLAPETVMRGEDSPALRATMADVAAWSRDLMTFGAPLVHRLPGRVGWELRLVVQGGLRILEKIERMDHATLHHRPRLHGSDWIVLAWRAMRMTDTPRDARSTA